MMLEKRCAMTEMPKDRENIDAFYHSDANRSDTVDHSQWTAPKQQICPVLYGDANIHGRFRYGERTS